MWPRAGDSELARIQVENSLALLLRDVTCERFHHKARAHQLWCAKTAWQLACHTARAAYARLQHPMPLLEPILSTDGCLCPHGCPLRIDSSDHILQCISNPALATLRISIQRALTSIGVPLETAARLGHHPSATEHILCGTIPPMWEAVIGSSCDATALHTPLNAAFRSFTKEFTDLSNPAIALRRSRCHAMRNPDHVACCVQRYLPFEQGGAGLPTLTPAPSDRPHYWAVSISGTTPLLWFASDVAAEQNQLLQLQQNTAPVWLSASLSPQASPSRVSLTLALAKAWKDSKLPLLHAVRFLQ